MGSRSRVLRSAILSVVVLTTKAGAAGAAGALYWDSNGATTGAGGSPAGTWGSSNFWNDQSNGGGGGTIGPWQAGQVAVFSAGTDATANYTVTVSSSQSIGGLNLEEGNITFTGGSLDISATDATFDAAAGHTATLVSTIAGSGGKLIKTGGGTILLGTIINQFNTYTKGTTINGGVVQFQGEANVAGLTNNPLGVMPSTFVPDQIRLDNGGVLSSTRVSSGSNVFIGANRGMQLGSGGGTLDVTDATVNNSVVYSGVISGTGPLTKTGPGTIQLQSVNTYQGDTYLAAGGLGVNATATFGTGAGTLHLDGGFIAAFNSRADTDRVANPILMTANTVLRNTNTQTSGQRILPFNSAPVAMGGTLTIRNVGSGSSNFTVRLHADGFDFARPIVIDHGAGINTVAALECINNNPTGVQTFSGQISGNGTLIRNGMTAGNGGMTELLSANTYTGGTQINRGYIGLGDNAAAGTGTITFGTAGSGDDPSVGLYAVGAPRDIANPIVCNVTTHVTFRGNPALTLNGPIDLGNSPRQLTVNNASITANNSITGNAGFTKDGTGTLILNGANSYAGATTITDGTLILGDGYSSSSPIDIQNTGSLQLAPTTSGTTVLRMNTVTLGVSGEIDLQNNKLITTDPAGTYNGTSYTGVSALIAAGRNGTAWTGPGLVTSQSEAANSNYTSLGIARGEEVRPESTSETALWAGQVITGTDTLVMYTYGGDATLDGKINIDDYVRIDTGLANDVSGWSNGDFNYDGKINIDDYTTVIDANIGNQDEVFFTAGSAGSAGSPVTAVPEPIVSGLLILFGTLLAHPRSRRAAVHKAHG
jgi:autotransporter-associated beta strand protein